MLSGTRQPPVLLRPLGAGLTFVFLQFKKDLCRHWARGFCCLGDSCRFRHFFLDGEDLNKPVRRFPAHTATVLLPKLPKRLLPVRNGLHVHPREQGRARNGL